MTRVAAAVIQQGDRILVTRRGPGRNHAGCWEFPGGKVEPGETPQAALQRELREELALEVEVGDLVARITGEAVELWAFHARVVAGQPELREHDRLEWMVPAALGALPMTDLDRGVVRLL